MIFPFRAMSKFWTWANKIGWYLLWICLGAFFLLIILSYAQPAPPWSAKVSDILRIISVFFGGILLLLLIVAHFQDAPKDIRDWWNKKEEKGKYLLQVFFAAGGLALILYLAVEFRLFRFWSIDSSWRFIIFPIVSQVLLMVSAFFLWNMGGKVWNWWKMKK